MNAPEPELTTTAPRATYWLQLIAGGIAAGLGSYFLAPHIIPSRITEAVGGVVHDARQARDLAVFAATLSAGAPAGEIPVPVIGVPASSVADSYGAARGSDRSHEGLDIFAPKGTLVRSATEGVVARIGTNRLGGNIVFILGPGGERYYYAHLDSFDPLLSVGQRVGTTTLIGTVGTTGNAAGTPPHLHFGIYRAGGAVNPFERLR